MPVAEVVGQVRWSGFASLRFGLVVVGSELRTDLALLSLVNFVLAVLPMLQTWKHTTTGQLPKVAALDAKHYHAGTGLCQQRPESSTAAISVACIAKGISMYRHKNRLRNRKDAASC
jgi:hypothetical protein